MATHRTTISLPLNVYNLLFQKIIIVSNLFFKIQHDFYPIHVTYFWNAWVVQTSTKENFQNPSKLLFGVCIQKLGHIFHVKMSFFQATEPILTYRIQFMLSVIAVSSLCYSVSTKCSSQLFLKTIMLCLKAIYSVNACWAFHRDLCDH